MKPWAKQRGFTIVELLIVIVVIGVLASITIVAYNGIQKRGRDAQRATDISNILKSLEAYKAINGVYPLATSTSGSGSYELSTETSGTFMEYLVPAYFGKTPVDPINDGTRYYRYYRYDANTMATYGCPGRGALFVLYAFGFENVASMPTSDPAVTCGAQGWSGGSSYLFRARFENG